MNSGTVLEHHARKQPRYRPWLNSYQSTERVQNVDLFAAKRQQNGGKNSLQVSQ
ncbi:hypothetical protein D3C75_222960 [compost metagenome]